jgi:hypothetical protein
MGALLFAARDRTIGIMYDGPPTASWMRETGIMVAVPEILSRSSAAPRKASR